MVNGARDPLAGITSFAPEFWRLVAEQGPASRGAMPTSETLPIIVPDTPPILPRIATQASPQASADDYAGSLIIRVPPDIDPKMEIQPGPVRPEECYESTKAAEVRKANHEADARLALALREKLARASAADKPRIQEELDKAVARVQHGESNYLKDKKYLDLCRA